MEEPLEGRTGGVHSTPSIAPKTISMAKSSFIIHITNNIIRIAEPLRSLLPINRVRLKMYVVFNNRFRNIQTTSPPPSSANLLFLLGSEILSEINYRLAIKAQLQQVYTHRWLSNYCQYFTGICLEALRGKDPDDG